MTKAHILYVDDEINNLIAFKANFRRHYQIYTADSAEEGKRILKESKIHVIVTDQRMPSVTGVEFLESIIKEYPDPVRILLTGYADIEAVIAAINRGQIYRYAVKPFNADELKEIIDNAYNLYSFKERNKELLGKYKKIFEESNDAIFIVNAEGSLVDFNDATINLLKYSRNQLNDIDYKDLIHDENTTELLLDELKQQGNIKNFEIKLIDYKKEKIDCLISINAINNEQGESIGYQGIIKDFTEQRRTSNLLVRETLNSQEKERDWFARDLHDNISQQLASINFYLRTLQNANDTPDKKLNARLGEASNSLNKVLNEIRDLCYKIMPRTIINFGLDDSIKDLCFRIAASEKIKINFRSDVNFPALDKPLEITIFRAIQELLGNAIQYGKATMISTKLNCSKNQVMVFMQSDGTSFHGKASNEGGGNQDLLTLKSRIESYNGEMKLSELPGKGTLCQIIIPIAFIK